MNNFINMHLFIFPYKKYAFIFLLLHSQTIMAQTWTRKTDFINGPSLSAYAFTINDTIYVGNTGATGIYKYDFTTDTWSAKANAPAILYNRTCAIAFAVNGKGYMIGGINANGFCMNDVWQYDPGSDSWVQKANFPGGKRASGGSFVIGNKAYYGGGYDTIDISGFSAVSKNDFWQYDPSTDTWTAKANIPYDSSYLLSPFSFSINGKGYLSCGHRFKYYSSGSYKDTDVSKTFEYDPLADTWTQKAPFPGLIRSGGISFVLNNIAYCGTGMNDTSTNNTSTCYNDFYSYSPVFNSWDVVTPPAFPARTYSIAAIVSAGKAYLGTGWASPSTTIFYQDWWEFKPAINGIVNEDNSEVRLNCYPNPCNRELTIQIPGNNTSYSYTIYNFVGQKVLENTLPANKSISTATLATGNFLLVIRGNGKEYRQVFGVLK